MSYDAYMTIDTGGEEPVTVHDIGNMTSNVSCMWTKALGFRLAELDGKTGAECLPDLVRAVAHISAPENRAEYSSLNPSNGWGNHGSAMAFLEAILHACRSHPKATLRLCY